MYRSGREETLKQFCGVIPGDRTTRGFLDPTDVSFNLQKCPQKKKFWNTINKRVQLGRYRHHHFAAVDDTFNSEEYINTWADSDLLDDNIRGRLANIRQRFFSYDP